MRSKALPWPSEDGLAENGESVGKATAVALGEGKGVFHEPINERHPDVLGCLWVPIGY